MYDSSEIANRIRSIAKLKNISINCMLSEIGLGRNTLAHFKTSMPRADNLAKIADYLEVSVDYLLGRTSTLTMFSDCCDNSIRCSKNTLSDIISVIKYTIDNIDFEKELRNIEDLRYQALLCDKASYDESELIMVAQDKVLEKVHKKLELAGFSETYIKGFLEEVKCFND